MIHVGITSIPERIHCLDQTIDSLLNQSLKPDAIYVNLPKKTRRGVLYPEYKNSSDLVIINECIDMGPITKLYPLLTISAPDDIIILVDDDHMYSHHTIETLARNIDQYPAVGFSARNYENKELKLLRNVSSPSRVTLLETVSAVAYKRWALKDHTDINDILFRCHESLYCDDIVIAAILNVEPHIIPDGQHYSYWNHMANGTPDLYPVNLSGRNERVYTCIHSL